MGWHHHPLQRVEPVRKCQERPPPQTKTKAKMSIENILMAIIIMLFFAIHFILLPNTAFPRDRRYGLEYWWTRVGTRWLGHLSSHTRTTPSLPPWRIQWPTRIEGSWRRTSSSVELKKTLKKRMRRVMMNKERYSMKKNSWYYNHALSSPFSPLWIQKTLKWLGPGLPNLWKPWQARTAKRLGCCKSVANS